MIRPQICSAYHRLPHVQRTWGTHAGHPSLAAGRRSVYRPQRQLGYPRHTRVFQPCQGRHSSSIAQGDAKIVAPHAGRLLGLAIDSVACANAVSPLPGLVGSIATAFPRLTPGARYASPLCGWGCGWTLAFRSSAFQARISGCTLGTTQRAVARQS